jgi:hypothetical protein
MNNCNHNRHEIYVYNIVPQKPQEALNLLVREERYWAPFYMPLYTAFTQFAESTSQDCK